MSNLITAPEVYSAIGKKRVDRCLNDSGSGETDEDAINLILANVSSWIRGKVGPVTDLSTLSAETAGDLKRIALDVARAYLAERAPEVMRQDSEKIFKRCAADIKMVRMGEASLGTEEAPEPLANNGARITSGNPNDALTIPARLSDDWGDFG